MNTSGTTKGFAKKQTTLQTSTCKNATTYEINWKYKTNLSGDEIFVFTGKQLEGFNQKKMKTPIKSGDIVRFKRDGHSNNGLKAIIKSILKPLSVAEMAEQGKDIRGLAKFPPVYHLEFSKSPFSRDDQLSELRTSNSEELHKIINFKSKLCINWRKEGLMNYLKSNKVTTRIKRSEARIDFNTKEKKDYNIIKNTILQKKIEREIKKIFMKNKKFIPDAISAWESENYQEYNKDELIPPDGTYYIMSVVLLDLKQKILTNKDGCDKNPPKYKLWVTINITLRKEALDIGSDILYNGKLFLGCDKKKQTVLNILNEIKNEAEVGLIKIQEAVKIQPKPTDPDEEECDYPDAKIEETDVKEDVDVQQVFTRNQKVLVASKEFKWAGMLPGKIKKIIKSDRDTSPIYNIELLDSNVIITNVENEFIRPMDSELTGGKKKKRKTKKKKKKRTRMGKTKKRRRRK